jgi:hypothetical protein
MPVGWAMLVHDLPMFRGRENGWLLNFRICRCLNDCFLEQSKSSRYH